jgi:hypothetical protein
MFVYINDIVGKMSQIFLDVKQWRSCAGVAFSEELVASIFSVVREE